MKIFFDCEFTGLHQLTTLVSIGFVAEDGRQFYAEATDYDKAQVNQWIEDNVIKHLYLHTITQRMGSQIFEMGDLLGVWGNRFEIASAFSEWIKGFGQVEMWSDVLPYDWVLFCELFPIIWDDTAERLPRNVYYIPFDIATLMKIKGVDPDISREEFSGVTGHVKHNALDDARIIEACYNKLMSL